MMRKTVFVTGVAGFIGFHTALALQRRGDDVVGLDNFNAYYSPELKRRRAQLLKEEGVEVFEGDLNDQQLLRELFDTFDFTHVLNLAAQAGVRYARQNPAAYLESNISGFLTLLEQLKTLQIPLIYASSSSVYGTNEKTPFAESDRTDQPASLYAATKKANELMAYSYHHVYGLKTTGLRYFTVYGPWGRPDMAYFSFTKAILEEQPIHLFNQGNMWRDFTYIDDVVHGTVAALDLAADNAVFNLGNHRPEKLVDLVAILERLLGKKGRIVLEGVHADEVETTYADIELSQQKLGFYPKTSLEEGLAKFVEWYLETHVAALR